MDARVLGRLRIIGSALTDARGPMDHQVETGGSQTCTLCSSAACGAVRAVKRRKGRTLGRDHHDLRRRWGVREIPTAAMERNG
ncbi:hypothetical protein M513_03177 [Trichuris suis]|uniref:Uncharacterized protein n=1 Tax=Trichuris suis TaxID=68888 RepID=A0A085MFQ7_9BILA|nr:hypothetical protein M513_03177 [Trichuris suis]